MAQGPRLRAMPLTVTPTAESWADEIASIAAEVFDAVVDVVIPGEPGKYDPKTDGATAGTPDTPLITERAARIQHLRLPAEVAGSREWATKRRYRIQFVDEAGDPFIPMGAIARVRSSPNRPHLTKLAFQVTGSGGSSHGGLNTLETITESRVVPSG